MSGLVRLATRWLAFHRGRTLLLVGCLALAFLLPITVGRLMAAQGDRMRARAVATPYVVGAPGSRYDLVVSSLWFRGRTPGTTSMREMGRVEGDGRGVAVPLLVRHSAGGMPLVGTSYDYFERRGLHAAKGRLPAILGEAVLGATASAQSGVGVDGHVLTDADGLLGMGLEYPVRLRVVGVLAPSGSADDDAVFTDLQTTWLVEGLLHGHADAARQDPARVLGHDEAGAPRLDSGIVQYTEVSADNLDSFHLHGELADMPLTGILVWPNDERGRTILLGRYGVANDAQMLEPTEVVDELLGFVASLKRFFDAQTWLVGIATALLLVLVVALTIRTRERELLTLRRIGVSRARMAALLGIEVGAVLVAAAALASVAGWALARVLARSLGLPS